MIDYAYPTMMAEKALKDLHNAMLQRKYEEARQAAWRCMAECKVACHSITVMEEEDARQASARA
jgi:hypothetical protein